MCIILFIYIYMHISTMMSGVCIGARQQCKVVDSYTDQYGLAREREFVCVCVSVFVFVCGLSARAPAYIISYLGIIYHIR